MRYKNSLEIENDIFLLFRDIIAEHISGKVFRNETRGEGLNEDALIAFVAGLEAQVQKGVVAVSIFVPRISNGSRYKVRNVNRCQELASLLSSALHSLRAGEYLFTFDRAIEIEQDGESDRITLRIKYQRNIFH